MCAVYSDDPRIEERARTRGIQHLYYRDFTADYVSDTSFEAATTAGSLRPSGPQDPARVDPYTTCTRTRLAGV